jgi:hypothetical protein
LKKEQGSGTRAAGIRETNIQVQSIDDFANMNNIEKLKKHNRNHMHVRATGISHLYQK